MDLVFCYMGIVSLITLGYFYFSNEIIISGFIGKVYLSVDMLMLQHDSNVSKKYIILVSLGNITTHIVLFRNVNSS